MVKILVAVAERQVLRYLADGLAGEPAEIHEAGTIAEVLDKVSEERFDVIVTDIFQPIVEGVALIATVARFAPKTRVIALMDFHSARAKSYDLGLWVDSVITKPFAIGRIRSEVEWVLSRPARRAPISA